jgi:phenylacetate-CoA ligase
MSAFVAAIPTTPLHDWIAGKVGVRRDALSRVSLAAHQLALLNETIAWAREHSAFYRERLTRLSGAPLASLEGIRDLPFTTPADLARDAGRFVCVSQEDIRHVVTLETSGTGGDRKRIFFTESDLELALDFFEHGVSAVAAPGNRMVIALPGERIGSVGSQLARGIARAGVIPVPCGVFANPAPALALLEGHRAAALIGIPVQILALACHAEATGSTAFRDLRSIVLCSDHVPSSLVLALRRHTEAAIFEHYGMTEMGLGGGIDCQAHAGYHLRDCDFLFEIVDLASGEPLPEGEGGEIVFTTLTRRGMPLIRYRTGDLSRFLSGSCACGTTLRRLERVRDRVDSAVSLGSFGTVTQSALDDALFSVDGVVDFTATITPGESPQLNVIVCCPWTGKSVIASHLARALDAITSVRTAQQSGALRIRVQITQDALPAMRAKRKIRIGSGA